MYCAVSELCALVHWPVALCLVGQLLPVLQCKVSVLNWHDMLNSLFWNPCAKPFLSRVHVFRFMGRACTHEKGARVIVARTAVNILHPHGTKMGLWICSILGLAIQLRSTRRVFHTMHVFRCICAHMNLHGDE